MADNKQEVIDILLAKVDKLMKQNEAQNREQKESINKLIDMNNILLGKLEEKKDNINNIDNTQVKSLADYYPHIFNCSLEGDLCGKKYGCRILYRLTYLMDLHLTYALQLILNNQRLESVKMQPFDTCYEKYFFEDWKWWDDVCLFRYDFKRLFCICNSAGFTIVYCNQGAYDEILKMKLFDTNKLR